MSGKCSDVSQVLLPRLSRGHTFTFVLFLYHLPYNSQSACVLGLNPHFMRDRFTALPPVF